MKKATGKELIAFGGGVLIGILIAQQFIGASSSGSDANYAHSDEYHIHADFLIYVRDQKIDLGGEPYMTTAQQKLHKHTHLHDSNGEVQHIHNEGTTFAEFINSLDLTLTDDCLTYSDENYCSGENEKMQLLVNGVGYEGSLTDFRPQDGDRLLLYYGPNDTEQIAEYMNEVKNDACFYSGTCPDRGIAPPESCGLTCEL